MIKTHLIPEAYKKMELFLQDYNMKYKRIDSTNLDPDAVVEIILNYLSEDGILWGFLRRKRISRPKLI